MTEGISPVPRAARPYQGEPAGLVSRFLAATIDTVGVAVVVVATYAGTSAVLYLARPRDFQPPEVSFLALTTAGLVLCVLYLTLAWTVTGKTYGDHVMGLRVVAPRGGRVRVVRSLVRALLYVAFPIGLLWCVVGTRRSLQDALLGTAVIYDWTAHHHTQRTGPLIHGG
ncbi:MAG TPA: RDD family protein [Marmoricola sp.]|nr:RDD family protein [Marmoricola sp.]